jgi:hypothetical protein
MKKPVWCASAAKWLKIPTVKWSDPATWRTFDGTFMLFVIGGGWRYQHQHQGDHDAAASAHQGAVRHAGNAIAAL